MPMWKVVVHCSVGYSATHVGKKKPVAACSNRVHTGLNNGWCSGRSNVDHVRSKCVQQKITCRGEAFLSLKIKSFLHSQSNQSKAYAPEQTHISVLNLFEMLSNQ